MAPRPRKPSHGQLPLACFVPDSDWRAPRMEELPSWAEAKRVAIDIETRDPLLKKLGPGVRRGGYMCGLSFAIEDGPSFYLPMRHRPGGNLDPFQVIAYMRDQARLFKGDLVGANMGYDLDYLMEESVEFKEVRHFRDVQIADPCINELHKSYSLQAIAERHGFPGKDQFLLEQAAQAYNLDPKTDMWQLDPKFVGKYAEQDVKLPLQLLRRQERLIDDQDLWQIYDLESELLPVLVRLRRRGVRVDLDKLDQVEKWAWGEASKAMDQVHDLTGCRVDPKDVWQPTAMAAPLRKIGVVFLDNAKPSVTKELLGGLDHPVAKALLHARKMNKLCTTFAKSVHTYITNGRIHCTYNQMRKTKDGEEGDVDLDGGDEGGARYGRLSCVDPNLQHQPARDDFAKLWRSIYVPEDGTEWYSNDYSQQEPRWLTHFAELCGLAGARAAAQKYRDDPKTDNHDMMTRIIHGEVVDTWEKALYKKHRTYCKQIYLGKCYGMGGVKLCRNLGLPTKRAPHWDKEKAAAGQTVEVAGDEGQAIIDKFDRGAPYVRGLAKLCEKTAKQRGYIQTVLGRRCHFPELEGGGFDWTHKALNRLIQGSSADQTKRAMIECDRAGLYIVLQVHDEIGGNGSRADAERCAEIMRTCVPCNVPAKVDIEMGPSWGGSM